MTRLCVIGRGTSGSEAAREAEMRGAEVTVVERLEEPDPPYVRWPDLVCPSGSTPKNLQAAAPNHRQSRLVLTTEAKSVEPGSVRTADGCTVKAEQIVIATGCGFETISFPGYRKPGVLVLNSMNNYSQLKCVKEQSDRVVVCGEGARTCRVAETLLGGGRRTHLLVSTWQNEGPSPAVMAAIEGAAKLRGVSFLRRPLVRAVGSPALEAIVAGGDVVPCDALVIVPKRVPRVVPFVARLGPRGGFLVDRTLKTDSESVHAAGGCAELETLIGPFRTLEDEPAMTGRIAGANCMGERFSVGSVRSSKEEVFGLVWSRIGIGPSAVKASGLAFATTSFMRGDLSACTIVYEKPSGRVLGVEWVDDRGPVSPDAVPLSSGLSLRMLAYRSSGTSSDISLVADTARLGFSQWQRS